jgi:hypothetical protein
MWLSRLIGALNVIFLRTAPVLVAMPLCLISTRIMALRDKSFAKSVVPPLALTKIASQKSISFGALTVLMLWSQRRTVSISSYINVSIQSALITYTIKLRSQRKIWKAIRRMIISCITFTVNLQWTSLRWILIPFLRMPLP